MQLTVFTKSPTRCDKCYDHSHSPDRWVAIKNDPEKHRKWLEQKRASRERKLHEQLALITDPRKKQARLQRYLALRAGMRDARLPPPVRREIVVDSDPDAYDPDPKSDAARALAVFHAAIVARWKAGESVETIGKHLRLHGVAVMKAITPHLPPDFDKQIRERFVSGASDYQIAAYFKLNRMMIRNRLKIMGVSAKDRARPAVLNARFKEHDLLLMRRLYLEERYSLAKLAKHFGTQRQTIRSHLLRMEVTLRSGEDQWKISTNGADSANKP